GKYRLYSRKKNPKTGKRRNLGTFKQKRRRRNTNARFSISSGGSSRCFASRSDGFLVIEGIRRRFKGGTRPPGALAGMRPWCQIKVFRLRPGTSIELGELDPPSKNAWSWYTWLCSNFCRLD